MLIYVLEELLNLKDEIDKFNGSTWPKNKNKKEERTLT